MTGKSSNRPSLRDLRLMRLLIDVIGEERHAVSLRQVEEWLNGMVGRPITAKNGHASQVTRQDSKGEITFWLSAVE